MIFPRQGPERGDPVPDSLVGGISGRAAPSGEGGVCAPPHPRELSDYTILEPIGSGLRGTVFRARSSPGRIVALKVFNPGVEVDIEALRRFAPFSDGGIAHPNLVPVEAVGRSEGKAFCSMALLQGDPLEAVLAEMRGARHLKPHLSPLGFGPDGAPRPGHIRHAVTLLLDVADGLERVHAAGMIHGRLSPRNLILTPTGRLVVTDFGAEESLRNGQAHLGAGVSYDLHTLAYRAPEELDPGHRLDVRTDVYALGAILYELLTGRPPFAGRDPRQVREDIAEGIFTAPSEIQTRVSRELEAVVLQAMALDPESRYPSAGALAEDLRRLLRLEPTEAGRGIPMDEGTVAEAEGAGDPAIAAESMELAGEGAQEPPDSILELVPLIEPAPANGSAANGATNGHGTAPGQTSMEPAAEDILEERPLLLAPFPPSGSGADVLAPDLAVESRPADLAPAAPEEILKGLMILPGLFPDLSQGTGTDPRWFTLPEVPPEQTAVPESEAVPEQRPAVEEIATPLPEIASVPLLLMAPPPLPLLGPPEAAVAPPEPVAALPESNLASPEPIQAARTGTSPSPITAMAPAAAPMAPEGIQNFEEAKAALSPAREAVSAHATRGSREARERESPFASFLSMVLILAAIGGWTWFTIYLFESGQRHHGRAQTYSAAMERMEEAFLAVFQDDSAAAGSLVTQARELGVQDPQLESIEQALRARTSDPALCDLSSPRAALRREAVAEILRSVQAGERAPTELALLEGALLDPDAAVRAAAINAVARGGSSAPLLAAYPLGEGKPTLEMDGSTFFALARALATTADASAAGLLQGWDFDGFARLDDPTAEGEEPRALIPNLRILPGAEPCGFAREWIRSRTLLGSAETLALAERLVKGDPRLGSLAEDLVDAVAALGTPEAIRALEALAAPLQGIHGARIIGRLAGLGSVDALLRIAGGRLADPFRAQAVSAALPVILQAPRDAFPKAIEALGEILRLDPSPDVRRAAFRTLASLGDRAGAEALAPALSDPVLRDEALDSLEARGPRESVPVLLRALPGGDSAFRVRAARILAAAGDPAALVPLGALLVEGDRNVRQSAFEAMKTISPQRALVLAAGILSAGSPALRDLAMECLRRSPAAEAPPPRLALALRMALGIEGGNGAPTALLEARRSFLREELDGAPAGAPLRVPPRLEPHK